jgi:Sigma-54 interaction domain
MMQNSSKPADDAAHAMTTSESLVRLREDWRVARTAYMDLEAMRAPRANVLLRGSEGIVQNVLDMLAPTFRSPIDIWRPGERLTLPSQPRGGTMILREIGRLSPDEQHRLLAWLDVASGQTQVISTTAWPLLPRLQSAGFLESLYYRLNTIFVNLSL